MNKQAAAAYLGISERTLQNLMRAGKIGFRYESGEKSAPAVFDRAELERVKAARETPRHRPVVEPLGNPMDSQSNGGVQPGAESGDAALQTIAGQLLATLPPGALAALAAMGVRSVVVKPARPSVPVEVKLLLTIREASLLCGVPQSAIRRALEAGALTLHRFGRSPRVKRADLVRWIEGL